MPDKLPEDPPWMQKIDEELDRFEQDIVGLPKWTNKQAPDCLNANIEDLRRKTPDELNEMLFSLNQYALNIQRLINKLRAWERWTYSNLDTIEAEQLQETDPYLGWQNRSRMARQSGERAKSINAFQRKVRMQMDRLQGLPEHVHKIADCIRDMKFMAIKREKESYQSHE